jgi:hypothetical protein
MDTDTALVEAAAVFGKRSGTAELTPDGARMFARIFDLTLRAGIANAPDVWESKDAGRTYALAMIARIAEDAAKMAGNTNAITGEILQQAANRIIDEQRKRLGLEVASVSSRTSVFCFCYVHSDLFLGPRAM